MTLPTQGQNPWYSQMAAHLAVGHDTDGSNIIYPADAGIQFVGASGNDANDGRSPMKAKATIQAAYDALSSAGGTVFLMRGTYDVDGYTNGLLTLSATKPCVFTSLSGKRAKFDSQGGSQWDSPRIIGTGPVLVLIDTGYEIGHGMQFHGICFDMRDTNVLTGILSRDMNYLGVKDCSFDGSSQAGFAIRSQEVHAGWADTMMYRIEENYCRHISLFKGLCDETILGVAPNYPPGGNLNGIQITNNVVFGNVGYAIDVYNLQRSHISGNNLEGGEAGIILKGGSHKNAIFWQGGEGEPNPYLEFDIDYAGGGGAYGNYYQNFTLDGGVLVKDEAMTSQYAGGNYPMAVQTSWSMVKVNDYTMETGQWYNGTVFMNKATAISFYIDSQANVGIPIGATATVVQSGAGALTITKNGAVTINGPTATTFQHQAIRLIKTDINVWYSHFA